jgi:N-acetylmuramoyl-L-alanine amidase
MSFFVATLLVSFHHNAAIATNVPAIGATTLIHSSIAILL